MDKTRLFGARIRRWRRQRRRSSRLQQHHVLLLGEPESRIKRLQKLGLVLVDERHPVLHVIESQQAARIVHVDADAGGFGAAERRLHIAVPGGEAAAVPLQTPGEVVSGDAAVALRTLALDALVGQTHVRPFAPHVQLKVMASQVEALQRQHLLEVLEALWEIRIAVLPRCGVGHFLTLFSQTQKHMRRVGIQRQRSDVCGRKNVENKLCAILC